MHPLGAPLVSGEGVRLTLPRAGVGSRVLAAALDLLVEVVALVILTVIDVQFAFASDAAAVTAVAILEVVLVLAGYPIVVEWLSRGRTLGKLTFGLRVVRDDGGPIGLRQAAVRGLAGLILDKPGLAGPLTLAASVLTMTVSSSEKRLGDMLAGTVVLNERAGPLPLVQPPQWVPVPLQQWVLSLDLHRLDDRLALLLRQFITRAWAMSDAGRYALGEQLRERVLAVTSPPPPPFAPTPDLLMSVLAERRRRAASTGAQQPAQFPPPFAAARRTPPAQPNGPPPNVGDGPFVAPS